MDTSRGIMGNTWAGGVMPGPTNPGFRAFAAGQRQLMNRGPQQLQQQAQANAMMGFAPAQQALDNGGGVPMPAPQMPPPMRGYGGGMPMPMPAPRSHIMGAPASPSFGAPDTHLAPPPGVSPTDFRRFTHSPGFAPMAWNQQRQDANHARDRGEMLMDKEAEKAAREREKQMQTDAQMAGYQSFLDGYKADGHLTDTDLETLNHASDPQAKLAVMQALTKQGEDRRNRAQQQDDQRAREQAMLTPHAVTLPDGRMVTTLAHQILPEPRQQPAPEIQIVPIGQSGKGAAMVADGRGRMRPLDPKLGGGVFDYRYNADDPQRSVWTPAPKAEPAAPQRSVQSTHPLKDGRVLLQYHDGSREVLDPNNLGPAADGANEPAAPAAGNASSPLNTFKALQSFLK